MSQPPVLAALRKHKAGVFLIGLQIALTLAIVCNILFIVGQHVQRIHRPSGLEEDNLFLIAQSYIGAPSGSDPDSIEKLDSMQLTDLAALHAAPDVQSVTPVSSLPLSGNGLSGEITLRPGRENPTTKVNAFTGDQYVVQTLGLHLVAGRDFTEADIRHSLLATEHNPSVVIVTKTLADKLFPHGEALGKPIFIGGRSSPSMIIGIVARLLTATPSGPESEAWDSILMPLRIDGNSTMYAVRAKPGRMRAAMRETREALFKVDPMRVIQQGGRYSATGVHTFAQIRSIGYALDIFMAQVLTAVSVILLIITGIGMAGLTSFWVTQRRKQIGIRRALGARKVDILRYFQAENLIIAGAGSVAGILLAIGINLILMQAFEMERMPLWYEFAGLVVVLVLGQLAALVPARRASNVPPLVATR